MVKSFSRANVDDSESISQMVRAASKLSADELAKALNGDDKEAASIFKARFDCL